MCKVIYAFTQVFLGWFNNIINELDFSMQDDRDQVESGILPSKEPECVPGTDLPLTLNPSREVQSAPISDENGQL